MKGNEIVWEKIEAVSGMSFKEWNEYLNNQICKTFSVDEHLFTSPCVVDPAIEMINSGEPDILDSKVSYREEKKVN